MRFPNFIGGSYAAQHATAATERLVNWYVEQQTSPGAKAPAVLCPTPGVTTFASSATETPVRGLWAQNDRAYAVIGTVLYEIGSTGTLTSRGSVAVIDTDPVTITSNGDGGEQLFVTSGDVGYCFDWSTNTLTTELASGATMCGMLDGFIIVLDTATSSFQISALNDATTWEGGLVTVARSTAPDRWVSMAVVGKELYLFGEETSDVYYDAGSSPMPFVPHPSGLIPFGCAAPYSAKAAGDVVLWLAKSQYGQGQVVMASGFQARVVSTPALAYEWSTYDTITDAVASVHEWQGHLFYVLTFPTAEKTWVYDLTTNLWHERGTWDEAETDFDAWRLLPHCFAFGRHLVGDRLAGTIYALDAETHTDVGGLVIRRVRRTPVLNQDNTRLFFAELELDLEKGLGLSSGQGSDPTITLRCSNDGGVTWWDAGDRSVGAQGEYRTRTVWRRLGSARARVFEVVASDPIPWRITDAYLRLGTGKAS